MGLRAMLRPAGKGIEGAAPSALAAPPLKATPAPTKPPPEPEPNAANEPNEPVYCQPLLASFPTGSVVFSVGSPEERRITASAGVV